MTSPSSGLAQDPSAFGVGRLFWITSEAIVGADLETSTIVLWNPAAEHLFGHSVAEALGMPLHRLVPGDLVDSHLAGIERFRSGGAPVLVGGPPVDVRAVARDGSILDVGLSLTDVSDAQERRYVLAVIRDMTALRRSERELEVAIDAMSDFVATASHDLRSPLARVLTSAKTLRDHHDRLSNQQREELLGALVRGATHASRLVDDLLLLSQIRAGALPTRPQSVLLADAARSAADQSGVEADVRIDDTLLAWVDPHQLERILVNYLANASRYGSPPILVTAATEGPSVTVEVGDAGPGVPEEFVPRLFSRFARADSSLPGGTGLGLSIVQGLARANGGDTFYEGSDAGSRFGVRLPARAPDEAR